MIQEKDFLYRVPVKTSPITTPGGQIRNPEILVDIEGGEFMHGNILDANSTNKLINQSVDDKITEGGYVTKNLLEAETTRATAKENEIKAQVDIINGDSTTEGSFRKAIADVVAAAPEDLDTLKEIADKLAGNDDLHTALNQAITEKADASALLNEVARATGVENNLKATLVNYALNSDVEEKLAQKADTTMLSEFIDKTSTEEQAINSPLHAKEYISVFHNTADGASGIKITNSGILAIDQLNENASPNKVFATDGSIADLSQYADATQLSNYVLTTALNKQIDTLNTAISAKQDAGSYIPYDPSVTDKYQIDKELVVKTSDTRTALFSSQNGIKFKNEQFTFDINPVNIDQVGVNYKFKVNHDGVKWYGDRTDDTPYTQINSDGISLPNGDNNHVLTSNASTINIAEYATKSDLSSQLGPKADRSDLTALEKKVTANTTAIEGKQDKGNYLPYSSENGNNYQLHIGLVSSEPFAVNDSYGNNVEYGISGIVASAYSDCLATSDGTFKPIDDFALKTDLHNVIRANNVVDRFYELDNGLKIGSEAEGFLTMRNSTISSSANGRGFVLNWHGLTFEGRRENNEVPTTDGSFISLNNYVLKSEYNKKITALEARIAALEAKHQEAA